MSCLPVSGGCERKLIDPFVTYLNEKEDRAYTYVSCPDQQDRNRPQPDGLYADMMLSRRLVIERKTLTWPDDAIERHKAGDFLMDLIHDELGSLTSDGPYKIEFNRIQSIDREELKTFAKEVVESVVSHVGMLAPGCGVELVEGPWSFRFTLQEAEERDYWEPAKGLVITLPVVGSLELVEPTILPPALEAKIKEHFLACERKFKEYSGDRNIVLIDPHGDLRGFDRWWWSKVLSRCSPSSVISEVWLAMFDAVSDFEDGWIFEKVSPSEVTVHENHSA